jgi:AraC family transcriptional regulator of adaptative response/methylated-DNA-[protein]-cysteine methyltransferase
MLADTTMTDETEESRWRAVVMRDAEASFVYAVRSTGIYCRPTCPSRRPGRDQVSFYALPDAAERDGFRACYRCRPRDAVDAQVELVQHACRYIEERLEDGVTLAELGKSIGSSPYHLQRVFKQIMGISPRQYADSRRLRRLKEGLKGGDAVTVAVYDAGYGSSSRLYERAGTQLGMPPATYRRGGAGVRLRYATAACALGRLLVAATDRGICFVSLADSDDELETTLRAEYPAAEIARDDTDLEAWTGALVRHLAGQEPHLDLPLDVRATAFQRRVWQELQAIPYGETRTYAEIARSIGNPNAWRAVGHACATNPTSVVIPCHRATRTDGGLGGYRWGLERKSRMLAGERAGAPEPAPAQG